MLVHDFTIAYNGRDFKHSAIWERFTALATSEPGERKERPAVRLLHTSDLHVGSDVYADDALRGLEAVLASARQHEADALLIAGDLFDNKRVSDATVDKVFADLGALGKPVVVLPGNHDTLLTTAWKSPGLPPNLRLMRTDGADMVFVAELGLAVWGRPVYDHHPGNRPMADVPPRPQGCWYVPMAHGLFMDGPVDEFRSSPITIDEIAGADCDYVALGHVHALREVSQNGVTAYYSGAPSGSQAKTAIVVDLDPRTGVSVSPFVLR